MNNRSITCQWIYIIVATAISTIVLFYYAKSLPEVIPYNNLTKEMVMCFGQIIWQGAIILLFINRNIHRYLCHRITVSLLGALALIPMILYYQKELVAIEIRILLFLLVVSLMIIEHVRRIKKLKLPPYLTVTWITYRFLWLPILLF
ncbi:hypothetical protein ACWGOQ_0020670 [Aquimarina sp. M1]